MEAWTWDRILQQTLVIAVMGVMLWLVSKDRYRAPKNPGSLQHSTVFLVMGAMCATFFYVLLGSVFILGAFGADDFPGWQVTGIFFVFGSIGLSLVVDYFRGRHFMTTETLSYGSQFGRRQDIRWGDVVSVRYSQFNKWFVLTTKDGRKARVSVMLQGLPDFANHVLQAVPANAIEPRVHAMLTATAHGKLPAMYG